MGLGCGACTTAAEYDEVIGGLSRRIKPGGRIAVTGLRHPDRWPEWLTRLGTAMSGPFGVADDHRSHHPWEVIEAHTTGAVYEEALAGAIYVAAGTTAGGA